ncbi:MAG: glycosyltransferase [Lachnospiraceae bacterium]|nr:glycosyltransferase [Lachnospiraceae bacterium]
MRLTIVRLFKSSFTKEGYYAVQEIGMAKAWLKLGYKVNICFLRNDIKKAYEEKEQGINFVYVPAFYIGNQALFNSKYIYMTNPDLVQLNSDNQIIASYLMKQLAQHQILFYNYIGQVRSTSENRLLRFIVNSISKFNVKNYGKYPTFTKTKDLSDYLENLGINVPAVAPCGLDIDSISDTFVSKKELLNRYDIPINKKVLLFVGRLEKYKNPNKALELLKLLDDKYFMILVGNGSLYSELVHDIKLYTKTDRLKYIKEIPNDDIRDLYLLSDYLLNFSNHEIFGMAILEAMYHNLTVIAFKAPGPNFIIENEVSGFLVNNIDEMKNIIINEMKSKDKEPRKRIVNHFTWENTANIIYNSLFYYKEAGQLE